MSDDEINAKSDQPIPQKPIKNVSVCVVWMTLWYCIRFYF